jgi:probable selenium-dependent hydroxylase accessory protein YqeC
MSTPSQRFRDACAGWFLPGSVCTFVGAGGKTTALKRIAALLAESGTKVRLTTTTRVGIDEFEGWTVAEVRGAAELARAIQDEDPMALLVGGTDRGRGKYLGIGPGLIEGIALTGDTVLLVEGDGSRKRPMKVPEGHEPVIPSSSAAVFAVMGASAIGEPIDEEHCYNHRMAASLAGMAQFEPAAIASIAAHPQGCRKGVLSRMAFRLLVNQGDLVEKRAAASEALHLAREKFGIHGALVSFQKGELYDTTEG